MKYLLLLFLILKFCSTNLFSIQKEKQTINKNMGSLEKTHLKKKVSDNPFTEKNKVKYLLGISASLFSGMGISFQYIYLPGQRIKTVGFFYLNEDSKTTNSGLDDFLFSSGMEWQYDLKQTGISRIYFLSGIGALYSSSYDEDGSINLSKVFSSGLAIGFELFFWKHLAGNIDIGMHFQKTWENNYETKVLDFAYGMGLSYAF